MRESVRDSLGLVGTSVADKYRVECAVGEGGHAVVYKAEHLLWKLPVAIKCFRSLSAASEEARATLLSEFLDEGRLLAQLSTRDAAIVQPRDIGTLITDDGQWVPYMVMEWLDGESLDYVLDRELAEDVPARSLESAMRLLQRAAEGIDAAHRANIAHRDIKPENLFVIGHPRSLDALVKVLDFGVAKVMGGEIQAALQQTGTQATPFTPHYGAPEQFTRSIGATGPWTDVYAMALVLIEVLRGGLRVYESEDYLEVARASRNPASRPTPRAFGLAVNDETEAVFAKALAVSPAERYRTMGEFWSALESAGGFEADEPTSSARALPLAATLPTTAQLEVGGRPAAWANHRLAPKMAAATALLVLAGTLGYRSTDDSGDAPPVQVAASFASQPEAFDGVLGSDEAACPSDMVLAEAGQFFMGSDEEDYAAWQPAHQVQLDAFCIDRHEVSVSDYASCVDSGACTAPSAIPDYPKPKGRSDSEHNKQVQAASKLCNWGADGREDHPVNCVTWNQAHAFCHDAGKRLPTEAEWEYAARGSDGREFPWGDTPGSAQHMNACGSECTDARKRQGLSEGRRMYDDDDGFAGTSPVGHFPRGATSIGALDMVGNVWEWTGDWHHAYTDAVQKNPTGPSSGHRRVIRGGSYSGSMKLWLNPAFRYHQIPTASTPGIGFRCVQPID